MRGIPLYRQISVASTWKSRKLTTTENITFDYVLLKDLHLGQSGRTTVSRVFQTPERGSYYLGVPVPNELRKKLKKSEVVRKLGNTYKEANI